jgi:lipopolysaccharide/colanic/teichoic acid biosynthesis glycosyltransferase
MHKFRTMRQDFRPSWTRPPCSSDSTTTPGVTQVGHLLRSGAWTSCPTEQVAANLQLLGPRHEVPAGMIGWWQINCRGDIAPEQAVRLDAFHY